MKLLLADDHTLFRDALVQYIERSDINAKVTVCKCFNEAQDVLKQDSGYDLVILDLRMPGMDGMKGFEVMRETYPNILVALMSGVADEEDVRMAFDMGAAGYFPKTMSGKALLQAIKLVLTGERFMPIDQKASTIMPAYYDDGPTAGRSSPYGARVSEDQSEAMQANGEFKLTPRESEVLSYLVQGASNKEIANALGLQVVTVKLHVRGVCRKLDVKNRTQAALKAQEYGMEAAPSQKSAQ